jgi:hypothetical protein
MGTTLTGTTPQDTYDSLIKVTDNGPISGTAKYLSDGLGNDSALALSTGNVGIGTNSPEVIASNTTLQVNGASHSLVRTGTSAFGGYLATIPIVGVTAISNARNPITGTYNNTGVAASVISLFSESNNGYITFETASANNTGPTERVRITSAGNVGIGTSAPAAKLDIKGGNGDQLVLNNAAERFTQISFYNNSNLKTAIWADETNDEFVLFAASGYTTPIYANGAERVRVTADGLTFNGDTAAANALDDYEEGTWTIGVSFGGASVGVTADLSGGTYTKIGRQVTVNGFLRLTDKGSSTGSAVLTGLPFTIGNNNANFSAASLRLNNITFANLFQGVGNTNTTTIVLQEITEAGVLDDITNADFANNSSIMVSFTYFV